MKKALASKKAIFFTVDALIASIIILTGIIAVYSIYASKSRPDNISYASTSFISSLSSIKAGDMNFSYISELVVNGTIKNSSLNRSVVELIGELWATNHSFEAEVLSQALIAQAFGNESGMGAAIYVNGNEIYSRNSSLGAAENGSYLSSSFRLVSGIEEAKPTEGYSSRAILSGILSKTHYAYAYAGGLVGQGNITQFMRLPDSYSSVLSAYIEMDVPSNFTLKINGNYSGIYPRNCSGGGLMRAYQCNINSTYLSNFKPGFNTIEMLFSNYSLAYISGGFLRVAVQTSELNYSDVTYDPYTHIASKEEYLPGVSYVVNIYSSVYAPGNITNLEIFLNYTTDLPLFVNLAGVPIYYSEDTGRVAVTISNATIASMLNYSLLGEKTLPLKIGHYTLNNTGNISGGNADIILITDISDSMKASLRDYSNGHVQNCEKPEFYTDPDVTREAVAVCLDKIFINTIMNYSGNRIWLVGLNDDSVYYYDSNKNNLLNYVETNYKSNPSGNTCTGCALNRAYGILQQNSNASRKKFVILMSDGIPNRCCGNNTAGSCNSNSTTLSNSSVSTGACASDCKSSCNSQPPECMGAICNGPINSSLNAATRIRSINRSSIHSIMLGPIAACENANYTMRAIAERGNGTFFGSANATELTNFAQQLANEIASQSLVYQYQIVVINGVNSTLSPNSYVKLSYAPSTSAFIFGKIPITLETGTFGNSIASGNLFIPESISVSEARATSYSSYYWTHNMTVNGASAFNLSSFDGSYPSLGDPFILNIPVNLLATGNNTVKIITGSSPNTSYGGSPDDRILYSLLMNSSVSYSSVAFYAEGCNWFLEFSDGTNSTIAIPAEYSGIQNCTFKTASYDKDDAVSNAAYNMLRQLDINGDGILEVNINQQSLSITTLIVGRVPSMWGPAKVEVRVWK